MTTARDGFRAVVRDDPGDLATPCLLLAHALSDDPDSPPDATVAAGHAALDALAAQVSGHDHAALLAVLGRMAGRPGDHRRLEASLLPDVLRTGHGLPILLSIVWLEVARRSGIAACGLGVPGRFLIAVGASHEQSVAADVIAGLCTLADPFDGGSTLRIDQVQEFARQAGATGDDLDPVTLLAPAAPVDVLHRVLRNIRVWAARPERAASALIACEFALLLPRRPTGLTREYAELLGRTGRFLEAAEAYADYAAAIAEVDPEGAERARVAGRLARSRLN